MPEQIPYVGVTGFMNSDEVTQLLARFKDLNPVAKVMVGVLASDTTLSGRTNKYPKQYPKRENIKTVFVDHPLVLNLLHFNTHDVANLADQLTEAMHWAGPNCHGLQLNIAWPDTDELVKFRSEHPDVLIVLQVGSVAFSQINNDIARLAQKLSIEYKELIDFVLIDMSGGFGISLDIELCSKIVKLLMHLQLHSWFGIGVAGGLDSIAVMKLRPLFVQYPHLCVDAQGKLRNQEGNLDLEEAYSYTQYYMTHYALS